VRIIKGIECFGMIIVSLGHKSEGSQMDVEEVGSFPKTLEYIEGSVVMVDQTALPEVERYVRCDTWERVVQAILDLEVRGAPAIGIAAAFGMALAADCSDARTAESLLSELEEVAEVFLKTRPTAVNLAWAISRVLSEARSSTGSLDEIRSAVVGCAHQLAAQDLSTCRAIGEAGAPLLTGVNQVITHCNAGALATVGYGTALGVVRSAHRLNPELHVWADETRPVLQGARLTAYELTRDGIECTVITDGAAASVMASGCIGAAIVGADRIAANGDVANKIGTYGLALAARHHGIPFYVAAPLSTFDLNTADGSAIQIEKRPSNEVATYRGSAIAPIGVSVHNPAFDITPACLVDAIVTEVGVLRPPYGPTITAAVASRFG